MGKVLHLRLVRLRMRRYWKLYLRVRIKRLYWWTMDVEDQPDGIDLSGLVSATSTGGDIVGTFFGVFDAS